MTPKVASFPQRGGTQHKMSGKSLSLIRVTFRVTGQYSIYMGQLSKLTMNNQHFTLNEFHLLHI